MLSRLRPGGSEFRRHILVNSTSGTAARERHPRGQADLGESPSGQVDFGRSSQARPTLRRQCAASLHKMAGGFSRAVERSSVRLSRFEVAGAQEFVRLQGRTSSTVTAFGLTASRRTGNTPVSSPTTPVATPKVENGTVLVPPQTHPVRRGALGHASSRTETSFPNRNARRRQGSG